MTIYDYVKSRGLTVKDVCEKMGISRASLSQYNVRRAVTVKTLYRFAKAFTELGAPTKPSDLLECFSDEEK